MMMTNNYPLNKLGEKFWVIILKNGWKQHGEKVEKMYTVGVEYPLNRMKKRPFCRQFIKHSFISYFES